MPGFMFPLLLIAAFIAVMLGVVVITSYFWLRYMDNTLRKCPQCEARGAGEIQETVALDSSSAVDFKRKPHRLVVTKHFEDHYACNQCGHTWSHTFRETEVKRHKVPVRQP